MGSFRVLLLAVAVLTVSCSPGFETASRTPSSANHATFDALRARPLKVPQQPAQSCNTTPLKRVQLGPQAVAAHGSDPFYFGPWGPGESAGDFNKTPWFVDASYGGRLVVRGFSRSRVPVAFGFWPQGFGTPAARADVPIAFARPDQEGRTVVYQDELDIDLPAGGRSDAHFWSFPMPGCYAIQVDGDNFTHVTVIAVN